MICHASGTVCACLQQQAIPDGLHGLKFSLSRRQGRRMPNANTPSISLQHRAFHLQDKQVSVDGTAKLFS